MVTGKVLVKNKSGLHARPASVFVQQALKYKSAIRIRVSNKEYEAKSILSVLSACVTCGSEMEIICIGDDEQQAFEEMRAAVQAGLCEIIE